MLTAQIGFEANNINVALDHLSTERRRQGRKKLLMEAQRAAQRALEQLLLEPLVTNTRAYVNDTLKRHEFNPWAVDEELRLDQSTILWFVKAECDLLRAQGLRGQVVDAIERDMLVVLVNPLTDVPESLEAGFRELARRVEQDLAQLQAEGERSEMYRTIAGVLGVLGGCAVVAADTAAAAATTGIAAPLLGVSLPVGAEIISRSLSEVLGDD